MVVVFDVGAIFLGGESIPLMTAAGGDCHSIRWRRKHVLKQGQMSSTKTQLPTKTGRREIRIHDAAALVKISTIMIGLDVSPTICLLSSRVDCLCCFHYYASSVPLRFTAASSMSVLLGHNTIFDTALINDHHWT